MGFSLVNQPFLEIPYLWKPPHHCLSVIKSQVLLELPQAAGTDQQKQLESATAEAAQVLRVSGLKTAGLGVSINGTI